MPHHKMKHNIKKREKFQTLGWKTEREEKKNGNLKTKLLNINKVYICFFIIATLGFCVVLVMVCGDWVTDILRLSGSLVKKLK